jgi:sorbitol-specific phosphotransferase system component IIC
MRYDNVMLKDPIYYIDVHLYDIISLLTCLLLFTYCIDSIMNNERHGDATIEVCCLHIISCQLISITSYTLINLISFYFCEEAMCADFTVFVTLFVTR